VLLVAAIIFLGCIISPPALMDDVDAVHAQIARNMLHSGDWTIAHLDGVPYIEKAPLMYWLVAIFFRIFGVHDWVARIPLPWLQFHFAGWLHGMDAGLSAGAPGFMSALPSPPALVCFCLRAS
jgi:4-amino-4-deoxy-L-arabinose transferase-like glycosyltransferase